MKYRTDDERRNARNESSRRSKAKRRKAREELRARALGDFLKRKRAIAKFDQEVGDQEHGETPSYKEYLKNAQTFRRTARENARLRQEIAKLRAEVRRWRKTFPSMGRLWDAGL